MAKLTDKKVRISLEKDLSLISSILELNKDEDARESLASIRELLEDEPELLEILKSSDIKEEKKCSLIDNIFKGRVSEKVIKLIKNIFVRQDEVVPVVAVTAVPMKKEDCDRLTAILENKLNKTVAFFNEVDKGVIAGVLLKIEGKIFDGTYRNELESMKKTLMDAQLHETEV